MGLMVKSLKQMFETEKALHDSTVVLFPQSLEKNKKIVSPSEIKDHATFKYKETGMDVFCLNKATRTTNSNFYSLSQFEKIICGYETVINHPNHEGEQEVLSNLRKQFSTLEDVFDSSEHQYNQDQFEAARKPPYEAKNAVILLDSQKAVSRSESNILKENKKVIENEGELEIRLELQPDVDTIAASCESENTSDDFKTLTKWNCNSAELPGHNIKGEHPTLVHLNQEQETESHAILLLAVALMKMCLKLDTGKRLFFYQTENEKDMLLKILSLLEKDYFVCNEQTKWKYVKSDGSVVENLPDNDVYNLVTDIRGCRGAEFSECICAVDLNDTKLRHITLEGMSRATHRLIIVSTCNMNSAVKVKSATGEIIDKLLPEYISKVCIECSTNSDEDVLYTNEISDKGRIDYVNTRSWIYKKLLKEVKKFEYARKELQVIDSRKVIFERSV